jgi:hypothetical protein
MGRRAAVPAYRFVDEGGEGVEEFAVGDGVVVVHKVFNFCSMLLEIYGFVALTSE